MPRAPKQPIIKQELLNIPKEFIRFATPKEVAIYRAEKLKCQKLVEIGAGIGGQTLAFSKACKQVLAIELDKKKAGLLINNIEKLGIKNIQVLIADALSQDTINKIKDFQPNIIFIDTERPEKSSRTLKEIKPDIHKLIETYSKITEKLAIEIPPFTQDIQTLKYKFEQEFLSLNNQLNRLTLYFNTLAQTEKSAISLPSKEIIIQSEKEIKAQTASSTKTFEYLYSIDPTIVVANLTSELANKFHSEILQLNKPVLLSKDLIHSNFLTPYKIQRTCENKPEKIMQNIKQIGAGKIILRYTIDPKDYWKERNMYESQLVGNKELNLFINESQKEAILCSKI
jgi:hypothetical protein